MRFVTMRNFERRWRLKHLIERLVETSPVGASADCIGQESAASHLGSLLSSILGSNPGFAAERLQQLGLEERPTRQLRDDMLALLDKLQPARGSANPGRIFEKRRKLLVLLIDEMIEDRMLYVRGGKPEFTGSTTPPWRYPYQVITAKQHIPVAP